MLQKFKILDSDERWSFVFADKGAPKYYGRFIQIEYVFVFEFSIFKFLRISLRTTTTTPRTDEFCTVGRMNLLVDYTSYDQ